MTPEKDTCNTNSSADVWSNRIHNATACLDGYRDGWKHWCKDNGQSQLGIVEQYQRQVYPLLRPETF
jgi:hypothetical protein